jgi:predicted methyltransferase
VRFGYGFTKRRTKRSLVPRLAPDVPATGVGFKLDGESSVLRNPADAHKVLVFDRSIRGHTDQFAFRFRKP